MERQVDEAAVAAAISALVRLKQESTLAYAVESGRIVVQTIFAGSLDDFRRRGPKDVSLRRLADDPALPMPVRSLYLAVRAYELFDRAGLGDVRLTAHLSLTHVEAILPAPKEEQVKLLAAANAERLTVADIKKQVAVRPHQRRGGRKPKPQLERWVRKLGAHIDILALDDEAVAELKLPAAIALADLVARAEIALGKLKMRLLGTPSHSSPRPRAKRVRPKRAPTR